jgi:asparagine synthase (glutamine-hydrolysing)
MEGVAQRSPYELYGTYYDECPGSILDKAMIADQRFHLQSILAKVDFMSMAHGLEVRVPLLDRRIMTFAGRCALPLLTPLFGPSKYLLRTLAQSLGAPKEVIHGRKKGFNVPIAHLLRHELRPLGTEFFQSHADILSPFIRPDPLRTLWKAHCHGSANHSYALWPLLILALWLGE